MKLSLRRDELRWCHISSLEMHKFTWITIQNFSYEGYSLICGRVLRWEHPLYKSCDLRNVQEGIRVEKWGALSLFIANMKVFFIMCRRDWIPFEAFCNEQDVRKGTSCEHERWRGIQSSLGRSSVLERVMTEQKKKKKDRGVKEEQQ